MMAEGLRWWLVLEIAGLIGLPMALLAMRALPGRGYAFAKPVGLLVIGYVFWLALSLHVLPNRPGSVFIVFSLFTAIDIFLVRRYFDDLRRALSERVGYVIAVEVVFALTFAVAVYLRSFIPEIQATEKPMDFMFLNTASRSEYYPPADAWLAGFNVSYYYFGYVLQAMVAKLAAVGPGVAFNLGLASTAALAATAAFGLGYELVRIARAGFRPALAVGVVALVLVTVMGNLEGAVEFGVANGYVSGETASKIDVAGVETAKGSDACLVPTPGGCIEYPTDKSSFWWWWRATRISPDANSITEFPFFSFLLGDLHPHVMALPFVLSVIGLALAFWLAPERLSLDTWRRRPALLALSAVLVGGLGFLNTWDLPAFGFLVALLVVGRNLVAEQQAPSTRHQGEGEQQATGGEQEGDDEQAWQFRQGIWRALGDAGAFLVPLGVLALVLYAPFYASFSSQASGLDSVRRAATLPLHSFLLWGPLLALSLPLPLALVIRDRFAYAPRRIALAAGVPVGVLVLWGLFIVVAHGGGELSEAIEARGSGWVTAVVFGAGLSVCLLALWRRVEVARGDLRLALTASLALTTVALLLLLGSELFFVKDAFGSRMNTVFKLSYQAWLLLGISGAFSAYWLWTQRPADSVGAIGRKAWLATAAVLVGAALLYPVSATMARTEGLGRGGRTLDGLAWTRASVQEYAVVRWLRDRADPGQHIVEATGGQYTQAARIATWSGVPTVLGWAGHEGQWGRDGAELSQRGQDVDTAYKTESLGEALAILRKYDVTYIMVGSLERAKYPAAGLAKFETGLPALIKSGDTALYRIPPAMDGSAPVVEGRP